MSEIEKMYDNAGVKSEYRYDCNLADTIKPVEVFPLRSCSKGEIKDYCTNKQDYRYCKVYKVNKIYPPFTAEKQIELIKWLARHNFVVCKNLGGWHTGINPTYDEDFGITCNWRVTNLGSFEYALAGLINYIWQDLTETEQEEIKKILKG